MIRKTNWKVFGGLSAVAVGLALTGCGQNAETATGDHTPGAAPHAHDAEGGHTTEGAAATANTATSDDNHVAKIEATMAKFFPGATLAKKPFPLTADAAQHFSEDTGVKFSGDEKKWQVYEATKGGQRVGLGMMTHSPLPNGKDMHIAFAVDPKFAVTQVTALDAPNNAQMQTFLNQAVGKTASAPFKVGQGLKAPAGLSPQVAQISADAMKKGLAILDSNFNASYTHSH